MIPLHIPTFTGLIEIALVSYFDGGGIALTVGEGGMRCTVLLRSCSSRNLIQHLERFTKAAELRESDPGIATENIAMQDFIRDARQKHIDGGSIGYLRGEVKDLMDRLAKSPIGADIAEQVNRLAAAFEVFNGAAS